MGVEFVRQVERALEEREKFRLSLEISILSPWLERVTHLPKNGNADLAGSALFMDAS